MTSPRKGPCSPRAQPPWKMTRVRERESPGHLSDLAGSSQQLVRRVNEPCTLLSSSLYWQRQRQAAPACFSLSINKARRHQITLARGQACSPFACLCVAMEMAMRLLGQGLPAQSGSQAWFLEVPAIPGLLPHSLHRNPPRDCLCSFARGASRWSLHLHSRGPSLISSPALQLGRSRARSFQPPPTPLPLPHGSLLITPTSHNLRSATDVRRLNQIQGHGAGGRKW